MRVEQDIARHRIASAPVNPKNHNPSRYGRENWYPYYAGYSTRFVSSALPKIAKTLNPDEFILDPWNGSGTTTAVCSMHGIPSIGCDLNPAMIVVAKARLLQNDVHSSLRCILDSILQKARHSGDVTSTDPLLEFYGKATASAIRGIQRAIDKTLVDGGGKKGLVTVDGLNGLSSLAAFYLVLLFRVLRSSMSRHRSSNPVWIKTRRGKMRRFGISFSEISLSMRGELEKLKRQAKTENASSRLGRADSRVSLADSRQLPLLDGVAAGVITSPPYCTRIDYAVATRLELAVLGYNSAATFDNLRRALIGTTLTSGGRSEFHESSSELVRDLLESIKRHPSKASDSYYLRTYQDYFDAMERSIAEIGRVLRPQGRAVIVAQDSFYKEIHVDLPTIIRDLASAQGMSLLHRWNFTCTHTMRSVNPKAREASRKQPPVEAVLLLEKE